MPFLSSLRLVKRAYPLLTALDADITFTTEQLVALPSGNRHSPFSPIPANLPQPDARDWQKCEDRERHLRLPLRCRRSRCTLPGQNRNPLPAPAPRLTLTILPHTLLARSGCLGSRAIEDFRWLQGFCDVQEKGAPSNIGGTAHAQSATQTAPCATTQWAVRTSSRPRCGRICQLPSGASWGGSHRMLSAFATAAPRTPQPNFAQSARLTTVPKAAKPERPRSVFSSLTATRRQLPSADAAARAPAQPPP